MPLLQAHPLPSPLSFDVDHILGEGADPVGLLGRERIGASASLDRCEVGQVPLAG
nr:hypothetical protein RVX_1931 [Nitratidesulfovibrio sp. HK-II]